MIKTKLLSLFIVVQSGAIAAVLNQPRASMGVKVAYHAGKLARKVEKEVQFLNVERDKLIKEFGAAREGDGVFQVTTPEQMAAFNPPWEELANTEVEIDWRPLTRVELQNATSISEAQLMALEDAGLLIDGEAPTAANDGATPAS